LGEEVQKAVEQYGVVTHPKHKKIYAYEVDGYGNHLFMDDANIPSLLALPYLGCCSPKDPVYLRTRSFVLSLDNPYFSKGRFAEGIGGPHVGLEWIWPMSIIMRALTSVDDVEIKTCLQQIERTHAGTYFIHEAIHQNNPKKFTRSWFGWANSLFGELILKLLKEKPHLVA
jgi:meiotically up-regulated gene 157 (Mug157) protein